MLALRIFLLVWTFAMLAVHLGSRPILRKALSPGEGRPRWLRVVSIVRFEGAYYIVLLGYALLGPAQFLLAPVVVLGVIHMAGWFYVEARRSALAAFEPARGTARVEQVLLAVQLFDFFEAVVLIYVGWHLFLPLL